MEILALWIAFGILCAVIAPGRGRSAVAWLLLGFLFSVFALVALLALPRRETDTTKTCPECAETVKSAAIACRFCGHRFTTPAPEWSYRGYRVQTQDDGSLLVKTDFGWERFASTADLDKFIR